MKPESRHKHKLGYNGSREDDGEPIRITNEKIREWLHEQN
jgi:hypothetical protein